VSALDTQPMSWSRFFERCELFWRFQVTLRILRRVNLRGVVLEVSSFPRHIKNFFLTGNYERIECDFAEKHLNSDDQILEVGGAVGFVGLFCQKALGVGRYAVVEPNPATAELLRRNYLLNRLEPNLFQVALAAQDGVVDLEVGGVFWGNSVVHANSRNNSTVPVTAMTLQSLIRQLRFVPNTLIMDVEGAETLISFRSLPREIRKVLIELHPAVTGVEKALKVIGDLRAEGFKVLEEENSVYFLSRV
jgi:FkbM family methyltransferase